MRRKLLLVAGVVISLLLVVSLVIASENSVLAEYSGTTAHSSYPVVYESNESISLATPPKSSTVYIAVQADEPLKSLLENRLSERVRERGLRPIVVEVGDLPKVQLKGRVLFVYVSSLNEKDGFLVRIVTVDAIAYYSTAGDIVDFLSALQKCSKGVSSSDTERLMEIVSHETEANMDTKRIPGDAVFMYWEGLKAKSGILANSDPYMMLADYIADEIISGMRSVGDSK
ncbi:hypothetical protein [Thermococcus pacificus]|uniref:Uncharacterized protein n=1 Tax=Thermococcus pacificus TaxID=71998 RepID=A0A218P892_9EURY|nr:hypothetical protein [Thermococcus pacificus]ASJ06950.1 hypothetical protein A3L08_06245 [Thermococcus pacificus]